MDLPARVREFLTQTDRFATVATADEDGTPRQSFVWFDLDPDDRVRLNGRPPRRWWANVRRTGKVNIAVADASDQYRWVGLAAELDETITGEPAREDIIAMAYRYHDGEPDPDDIAQYRTQDRYTFLFRVVAVHDHLE